jgi:SulP family sulfate permease
MNAARLFPFLNELRHYSLRDFRADFVAALTVTPMAVPQAMAYALIAGVHPQYGIYACMLPVIVAALWGSARYLAAGPTNAISMVLFTTMSTVSIGGITVASLPEEARMPYIFGIALLCGLIQVGMGLARLGELANFISHSVMVAFSPVRPCSSRRASSRPRWACPPPRHRDSSPRSITSSTTSRISTSGACWSPGAPSC